MIEMKFATNPPIKTTYDTKVEFKSGGSGEVISVNGKKGRVVLTANDVGAVPLEGFEEAKNYLKGYTDNAIEEALNNIPSFDEVSY